MYSRSYIAKVCHDANRAYCQTIGDFSQPAWEMAPEWQKASAINGVNFHLDNPGTIPESSHENWMKEKIADGWMFGEKKDPVAKTHPCLVSFDKLPEEQKQKDRIFYAIVKSFME